ncbi:MAG TPA: flippase, partial [Candidatus Dormibacteraeota bacterium]
AGFGRFQTLVTYAAIVTVLIDLGFNSLYPREAARRPAEAGRYLGNLITLRLGMAVIAFGVFAAVLTVPQLEYLLIPGFLLMLAQSFSGLLRQTFYARQRVGYEAVAIVLEGVILLVLTLIGISANAGVTYFVWAYAIQWTLSCAYALTVLALTRMVKLQLRFEPQLLRTWLRASLPFAMTFVITTLYFKSDVPILRQFRPYAEVGWYTAAYKPFEALLFVPVSMLNVVYPILAIYHREAPDRLLLGLQRFYKLLLLVGWPLTVGMVVLAPGLAKLVAYPQSEPALAILGVGVVLMFVNNTFIAALNSIDRQLSFTWASVISMVFNISLNLLVIPIWGYLGASWSTVLTETVLLVCGWWLTRRYLGGLPFFQLSWRVVVAGLVMGLALIPFRGVEHAGVVAVVGLGAAVYGIAVLLIRALDAGELELLRRAARR